MIAAFAVAIGALWTPSAGAAAEPSAEPVAVEQFEAELVTGTDLEPPPAPMVNGKVVPGSWIGPYTMRNARANKCLDILGASLTEGEAAVQYTCKAGGVSQMWWEWQYYGDGSVYSRFIANAHSKYCLTGGARGTVVRQITCFEMDSMAWTTTASNPHLYRNAGSGLCLEIQGASPDNFARVVVWTCHGRSHQIWYKYAV